MNEKKTIFERVVNSIVSLSVFLFIFVLTASIIKPSEDKHWIMYLFSPAIYRITELIMSGYYESDKTK
jgi:hypothetical protein